MADRASAASSASTKRIRRRLPVAILSRLDTESLEDIARLAAAELGRDEEKIAAEIAVVEKRWGTGRGVQRPVIVPSPSGDPSQIPLQ